MFNMAPQLALNQGPQDALLYDNSRSYFTNVGYVRTSNFQVEYRDVDPQNNPSLGSTVSFVIPKAADLLGPVDLVCDLDWEFGDYGATFTTPNAHASPSSSNKTFSTHAGKGEFIAAELVESVGFAMIDKITFAIGSNDVETITGEQLNIINELMKSDEQRLTSTHILKTGDKGALDVLVTDSTKQGLTGGAVTDVDGVQLSTAGGTGTGTALFDEGLESTSLTGVKSAAVAQQPGYGKTRLMYFVDGTLCAMQDGTGTDDDGTATVKAINCQKKRLIIPLGLFFTKHPSQYFPLAAIAGCNDVRIQIKFKNSNELCRIVTSTGGTTTIDGLAPPQLKFGSNECKLRCHYVHVTGPEATTLMNKEHVRLLKLFAHNSMISTNSITSASNSPISMDLSFLHPVSTLLITIRDNKEVTSTSLTDQYKGQFQYHGSGKTPLGSDPSKSCNVKSIKLNINGQERHPSLAANGIERDYLMDRIMPLMHSNCSSTYEQLANRGEHSDKMRMTKLNEMLDRKEIYVFPFALNPEGANPSGAINFSKVSHAKLTIEFESFRNKGTWTPRVDVYAMYYNWLQIKDGRALLSFA